MPFINPDPQQIDGPVPPYASTTYGDDSKTTVTGGVPGMGVGGGTANAIIQALIERRLRKLSKSDRPKPQGDVTLGAKQTPVAELEDRDYERAVRAAHVRSLRTAPAQGPKFGSKQDLPMKTVTIAGQQFRTPDTEAMQGSSALIGYLPDSAGITQPIKPGMTPEERQAAVDQEAQNQQNFNDLKSADERRKAELDRMRRESHERDLERLRQQQPPTISGASGYGFSGR